MTVQLSLFDLLREVIRPRPVESSHLNDFSSQPAQVFPIEGPPLLPWRVEESAAKRTARAQIKDGWIVVLMPKRWPKGQRPVTIENLRQTVQSQFNRDWLHVEKLSQSESDLISISTLPELIQYVDVINQSTLQLPVHKIRIGQSRYTRLAQMNTRDRALTVSKFCLDNVPESALRYLIIHELAHLLVPNHSRQFWAVVAQYVPDYRRQSHVIQAFHRIRAYQSF